MTATITTIETVMRHDFTPVASNRISARSVKIGAIAAAINEGREVDAHEFARLSHLAYTNLAPLLQALRRAGMEIGRVRNDTVFVKSARLRGAA